MDSRFDGIAEFVAVARLGSFTGAAAELGVTKSAVGRAVSRLEGRLGAKLLHRTTRRLTLTSDGEAWLEHCLAALAELDRGEDVLSAARHQPSGRVRIDLPAAFGRLFIMPLLLGLMQRFPALTFNVSFTDRVVDLIDEGIDLVVRIGTLDDTPDLVARLLGMQQLVICGTPDYLARRGTPLSAADLVNHDCIVGWRRAYHVSWLLKQPNGFAEQHVIPVKHEICDAEMMLAAVRAGRGLAQLPLWLVGDELRRGELVTVLDGMSGGELPINLLWPRTRTLSKKIRVVIDEIVQGAHRFADPLPMAKDRGG
ncbi:MAG: LysR family transcriptional regulator [Dongiaceae bacterium]